MAQTSKRPKDDRQQQDRQPQRDEKQADDSREIAEKIVRRRIGALRELAKH